MSVTQKITIFALVSTCCFGMAGMVQLNTIYKQYPWLKNGHSFRLNAGALNDKQPTR